MSSVLESSRSRAGIIIGLFVGPATAAALLFFICHKQGIEPTSFAALGATTLGVIAVAGIVSGYIATMFFDAHCEFIEGIRERHAEDRKLKLARAAFDQLCAEKRREGLVGVRCHSLTEELGTASFEYNGVCWPTGGGFRTSTWWTVARSSADLGRSACTGVDRWVSEAEAAELVGAGVVEEHA